MVQEEFGQQAQILAVDSTDIAINLTKMRKSYVTPYAGIQGNAPSGYPHTFKTPNKMKASMSQVETHEISNFTAQGPWPSLLD